MTARASSPFPPGRRVTRSITMRPILRPTAFVGFTAAAILLVTGGLLLWASPTCTTPCTPARRAADLFRRRPRSRTPRPAPRWPRPMIPLGLPVRRAAAADRAAGRGLRRPLHRRTHRRDRRQGKTYSQLSAGSLAQPKDAGTRRPRSPPCSRARRSRHAAERLRLVEGLPVRVFVSLDLFCLGALTTIGTRLALVPWPQGPPPGPDPPAGQRGPRTVRASTARGPPARRDRTRPRRPGFLRPAPDRAGKRSVPG